MNRDNIKLVRDVIAALPDEKFAMHDWITSDHDPRHDCGTAACIGGWTATLLLTNRFHFDDAGQALGLEYNQYVALFCPPGYEQRGRYTRQDAIRTLDHLLETGEVRWPG